MVVVIFEVAIGITQFLPDLSNVSGWFKYPAPISRQEHLVSHSRKQVPTQKITTKSYPTSIASTSQTTKKITSVNTLNRSIQGVSLPCVHAARPANPVVSRRDSQICPLISTTLNNFLRSTSKLSNASFVLIFNPPPESEKISGLRFSKNSTHSASDSKPSSSVIKRTSISGR